MGIWWIILKYPITSDKIWIRWNEKMEVDGFKNNDKPYFGRPLSSTTILLVILQDKLLSRGKRLLVIMEIILFSKCIEMN